MQVTHVKLQVGCRCREAWAEVDDPRRPRDALWRLASPQRGYFTARQALDAGFSYQLQHFHSRVGNWLRVDRGVYRFREYQDLPDEETDVLVRWSLWSRGEGVVSHSSALAVHDLGIANPELVHLTVPVGFRRRDTSVVLHRAPLSPDDVEHHQGFRVTSPVRAVAESAEDWIDQDVLDSAVDDLLRRGLASRARLLSAAAALGPRAELGVERALRAAGPTSRADSSPRPDTSFRPDPPGHSDNTARTDGPGRPDEP